MPKKKNFCLPSRFCLTKYDTTNDVLRNGPPISKFIACSTLYSLLRSKTHFNSRAAKYPGQNNIVQQCFFSPFSDTTKILGTPSLFSENGSCSHEAKA